MDDPMDVSNDVKFAAQTRKPAGMMMVASVMATSAKVCLSSYIRLLKALPKSTLCPPG